MRLSEIHLNLLADGSVSFVTSSLMLLASLFMQFEEFRNPQLGHFVPLPNAFTQSTSFSYTVKVASQYYIKLTRMFWNREDIAFVQVSCFVSDYRSFYMFLISISPKRIAWGGSEVKPTSLMNLISLMNVSAGFALLLRRRFTKANYLVYFHWAIPPRFEITYMIQACWSFTTSLNSLLPLTSPAQSVLLVILLK
jgi:hypothetical protein